MRFISNALKAVVRNEEGGEVLEYALIAGLIVVAAPAICDLWRREVAAKPLEEPSGERRLSHPFQANVSLDVR